MIRAALLVLACLGLWLAMPRAEAEAPTPTAPLTSPRPEPRPDICRPTVLPDMCLMPSSWRP